jgi:UDPglucose 6-dehydrogenase
MKISNICCIGAGYVGGPTMAVIALKCPEIKVTVVDKSEEKINLWNSKDLTKIPVFEPGLNEIVQKVRGKNLFFSNDISSSIDEAEIIFIAVNTPTKKSGRGKGMAADLSNVIASAKEIAKFSKSDKIVVEKSTLPVRTAEKLKEVLSLTNKKVKFEVLSNPEFLAEGTAIQDLFKSDRVLIGGEQTKKGQLAVNSLVEIYKKWIPINKILTTNIWSSELSKLVSNAMLAQRISSINSLSAMCEKTGADINEISKAVGMDSRIGPYFLNSSVGFGGSCFQKDILNLVYLAKFYGLDEVAEYWHQVIKMNNYQKERFALNIIKLINNNEHSVSVSILGWAFKKNTNDSRESASIYVTDILLKNEIFVNVYDPMVPRDNIISDLINLWSSQELSTAKTENLLGRLNIENNYVDAIKGSSLSAILTEWDEFKDCDWESLVKSMKSPSIVYDGRNILPKQDKKINHIKLGVTHNL